MEKFSIVNVVHINPNKINTLRIVFIQNETELTVQARHVYFDVHSCFFIFTKSENFHDEDQIVSRINSDRILYIENLDLTTETIQ